MVQYHLTFDLFGSFGSSVPKLAIYYAGIKIGMAYASADGNSVDILLDSDREFSYDQLRFKFIDDKAEIGRSISISNIQLGTTFIDPSAFTSKNAIVKTADHITLTTGQHADTTLSSLTTDLLHTLTTETADTSGATPESLTSPEPVSISGIPEVFAVFAPPPASFYATITGTNAAEKLYGTASDDNISALDGNDKILAYAGNDLVHGGNGNDYIDGGDGNDTLYGDAGDDKIYGGLGNDTIYGGTENDSIFGGDGTDFLYGDDGNDIIHGDAGNDTIYGGAGNDKLGGDDGNDIIWGGDGDDEIFGDAGDDQLHGGLGNDRMIGNDGADTMYGDEGNDNMDGQYGNDTMYGGDGDDNVDGEYDDDYIDGGAGNDYLTGGQGSDTILGGTGNDIIHGGGIASWDQLVIRQNSAWGASQLWFNEQTQTFYLYVTSTANYASSFAAAQAATLNGVAGHLVNITSDYEAAWIRTFITSDTRMGITDEDVEGVWAYKYGAEAGSAASNGATGISSFYATWAAGEPNNSGGNEDHSEFYTNGNFNDEGDGAADRYIIEWNAEEISPDTSTNFLYGGDGNDQMYGDAGVDTMSGGNDDDIMFGLGGDDIMSGDAGNDSINGGAGNDTIDGGAGNDYMYGGAGTDLLTYMSATSAVTVSLAITTAQNTGGAGTDTISGFENLTGSVYNDTLTGDAGVNIINGMAGNDTINAGGGNDTVNGGTGNDTIYGGVGSDILNGDDNDDIIYAYDATSNRNHVGATIATGTTYVNATFGANTTPFSYADVNDPANVDVIGSRQTGDGNTGNGSLEVYVDGQNNSAFTNASGEWSTTVNITADASSLVLEFSYRHYHDTANDNGENSAAYYDVNGSRTILSTAYGSAGTTDTGWVTYSIDLGPVTAGQSYTIDLGLIHYGSNRNDEDAYARFDDVLVRGLNGYLTPGVTTADADAAHINTIHGGNGNDTIYGSSGNDLLFGDAGNDTIYSGTVDTLSAQINAILAANPNISYSEATGNFYQVVSNTLTWTGANSAANAATINGVGGHLATITSTAEHDFVAGLMGGQNTWLGGTDTGTEGVWRWVTGPENGMQFANSTGGSVNGNYSVWEAGQPNDADGTQDYLYMLNGANFADLVLQGDGSSGYVTIPQYIIEWEASSLLDTSKSNVIDGGAGTDTLYGSDGMDIFNFSDISAMDTINNFNILGHDAIDISDVLTGFNYLTSNLDQFVRLTTSGGNTILQVDANGAVGGTSWTNVAQINGVTGLDVDAMVTHHNLILS